MAIEGLPALERKLRLLPGRVIAEIRTAMEKSAEQICDMMRRLVPVGDSGALQASIGWTWGDAPKGSVTLGTVAPSAKPTTAGRVIGSITIYAGGKTALGDAFYARFVEFGTRPHSVAQNASVDRNKRQGEGIFHPGATAQPFFFPAYRANAKRVKTNMTRAMNKGLKQS